MFLISLPCVSIVLAVLLDYKYSDPIIDLLEQVKFSLEAAKLTQNNASLGVYDASASMFCSPLLLLNVIFLLIS